MILIFTYPKDAYLANTLSPEFIGYNKSGWTISGKIHEDWYKWINSFEATHSFYGVVKGDFEKTVYASSLEAFDHFMKYHKPDQWDYHDI